MNRNVASIASLSEPQPGGWPYTRIGLDNAWQLFDIEALWSYRDLLLILIIQDLKPRNKVHCEITIRDWDRTCGAPNVSRFSRG